jgi:hypothetical protein
VEEREEEAWVREQTEVGAAPVEHVATGVVAVAVGDGLERLFVSLGVQHIVAGGQSMNPSTAQILEAVNRCAADSVIVLPNNKNIGWPARCRARRSSGGRRPDQHGRGGASRLVVYGAQASMDDNTAMEEAAMQVRAGEVRGVRDTAPGSGPLPGDWIALARWHLHRHEVGGRRGRALLGALIGDDSGARDRRDRRRGRTGRHHADLEHLRLVHPDVELELRRWPAALPYLVGVE